MSLVASRLYRDGKCVSDVAIDEVAIPPGKDEFIWIGLHEPGADELNALQQVFKLHPLAIEDALNPRQIPKLDVYEDELFIVAKTAHLEGDRINYGETAIFVGERHIITVRHGSARAHTELRAQLEASPQLLKQGPDYVLHAIIDFIVDGYLPVMQTIEDNVLQMEQKMLNTFLEREQIRRLFRLRRQVILFQRIMAPTSEMVGKLAHLDLPCLDAKARPFFRDVLDHVNHVQIMVGSVREGITSVFEASNLLEQQRQGTITRQLAAWAAILAVPTAIAGLYGMNFENMPELKSAYGYYVVLGVIALLCGILYAGFRRAKWL